MHVDHYKKIDSERRKRNAMSRCRDDAIRQVPTENGIFDARKRLSQYFLGMYMMGYVEIVGPVNQLTDVEVEKYLIRCELDN